MTAFYGFLKEFGGRDQETGLTIHGIKVIEIMGTHDVVFSRGPFFAGVHEALEKKTAEQLALKLDNRLREILSAQEDRS